MPVLVTAGAGFHLGEITPTCFFSSVNSVEGMAPVRALPRHGERGSSPPGDPVGRCLKAAGGVLSWVDPRTLRAETSLSATSPRTQPSTATFLHTLGERQDSSSRRRSGLREPWSGIGTGAGWTAPWSSYSGSHAGRGQPSWTLSPSWGRPGDTPKAPRALDLFPFHKDINPALPPAPSRAASRALSRWPVFPGCLRCGSGRPPLSEPSPAGRAGGRSP